MSLVGYRWWYAGRRPGDGWRLRSVFQALWWDGPHLTARERPRRENASGIYAFKSWQLAVAAAGLVREDVYPVFGVVALWGKVVEHERGFRAEHAMIRRLIVPEHIVLNRRHRVEDACCFVDLDDIMTKRRGAPSPAPLLGDCVTAGDRKWRCTEERWRRTEEKTPDRGMIPALARMYGVDVKLGRAVEW